MAVSQDDWSMDVLGYRFRGQPDNARTFICPRLRGVVLVVDTSGWHARANGPHGYLSTTIESLPHLALRKLLQQMDDTRAWLEGLVEAKRN